MPVKELDNSIPYNQITSAEAFVPPMGDTGVEARRLRQARGEQALAIAGLTAIGLTVLLNFSPDNATIVEAAANNANTTGFSPEASLRGSGWDMGPSTFDHWKAIGEGEPVGVFNLPATPTPSYSTPVPPSAPTVTEVPPAATQVPPTATATEMPNITFPENPIIEPEPEPENPFVIPDTPTPDGNIVHSEKPLPTQGIPTTPTPDTSIPHTPLIPNTPTPEDATCTPAIPSTPTVDISTPHVAPSPTNTPEPGEITGPDTGKGWAGTSANIITVATALAVAATSLGLAAFKTKGRKGVEAEQGTRTGNDMSSAAPRSVREVLEGLRD